MSVSTLISKVLDAADKRKRRETEWAGIIIHHTGQPKVVSSWTAFQENIAKYLTTKDEAFVSAHFQINRDGEIIQLCDPREFEAFHAGVSSAWHPIMRKVVDDWNRYAIGIELIGDGNLEPYTKEQYAALTELCVDLTEAFPSIHPRAIYGHEEIAPGRKTDPGHLFDWSLFLKGYYSGVRNLN